MTLFSYPRIAARPQPADWSDDELLTLGEAVALFWPNGPLTVSTLRTAIREGTLPVAVVAGKFFVTPRALRELATCRPLRAPSPEMAQPERRMSDVVEAMIEEVRQEALKAPRRLHRGAGPARRPGRPPRRAAGS